LKTNTADKIITVITSPITKEKCWSYCQNHIHKPVGKTL